MVGQSMMLAAVLEDIIFKVVDDAFQNDLAEWEKKNAEEKRGLVAALATNTAKLMSLMAKRTAEIITSEDVLSVSFGRKINN
jgi:hypothetical protein